MLSSFGAAEAGIELHRMLKKGQLENAGDIPAWKQLTTSRIRLPSSLWNIFDRASLVAAYSAANDAWLGVFSIMLVVFYLFRRISIEMEI